MSPTRSRLVFGLIALLTLTLNFSQAAPLAAPLQAVTAPQHFDVDTELAVAGSGRPDLKYYYFVPSDYDPNLKYPLIVMLHGLGEVGTGAVTGGPMQPVLATLLSPEYRAKNPCFLLAPQLVDFPTGGTPDWWSYSVEINSIMAKLTSTYNIDKTRLYITGPSWGGFGTAAYLKNWPDLWAAGAPLCGNSSSRPNEKTPVWFFHASNDTTVDSRGSEENVYNMRAQKGNPTFTRFTTGGHDSWDPAYGNFRFWDWMLSQRLHAAGTNVIPQTSVQFPITRILTAQYGATLSLTGDADPGPADSILELAWYSDRIPVFSGNGGSTGVNSKSFFSSTSVFTAADIGKKLLISNDSTDSWVGYRVLACPSANEIQVDKNISSSALSNVSYRLAPEGSSHFPKAFTPASKTWQVGGIPLSSGINVISVIAKTTSWKSADAGNTWFGNGKIKVNYAAPVTDLTPPSLTVDQAVPNGYQILTSSDSLLLTGYANDSLTQVSPVSLTWITDFGAQGTASISSSGTWSAPNIPLKTGYNRITLTASDPSGNSSIVVLDAQRNIAPVATPDFARVYENTGGILQLLANDTDPDASPQSLWISDFTSPAHGTLSRYGRALYYKPAQGFKGTDSFVYTISDGFSSSQGLATVIVIGRPPVLANTVLEQNFDQFTDVTSYYRLASPLVGEFNDIGAEADSGGVTISNGRLTYTHSAITTGGTNGAGFTRFTGMTGRKLVEISFDFIASNPNTVTLTNGLFTLNVGNITSVTDYNTSTSSASALQSLAFINRTAYIGLRGGGGTSYWGTIQYNTLTHVCWVVNGDSVARIYNGPDGETHILNTKSAALFLDGVLFQANIPQAGNSAATINGLRMNYSASMNGMTFSFDNFRVCELTDLQPNTSAWFRAEANLPSDSSGDSTSTAGDGVPDMLKFAFNMAAHGEDLFSHNATILSPGAHSGLPCLGSNQYGQFTLSYLRLKPELNSGFTYQIQQSSDLTDWVPGEGTSNVISLDSKWDRVDWTSTTPRDKAFFRVGVTGLQ